MIYQSSLFGYRFRIWWAHFSMLRSKCVKLWMCMEPSCNNAALSNRVRLCNGVGFSFGFSWLFSIAFVVRACSSLIIDAAHRLLLQNICVSVSVFVHMLESSFWIEFQTSVNIIFDGHFASFSSSERTFYQILSTWISSYFKVIAILLDFSLLIGHFIHLI